MGMQRAAEAKRTSKTVGDADCPTWIKIAAALTYIDLFVFKSNTAARSLYKKLGFTWVEDLPPCKLPCGTAEQPIKMRHAL
ncbi:hypothetical protein CCL23_12980 [Pseudomonas syringae]|nr:hypothetical protein CCL23_12980 [Pseudomonas syringae]